jgi:hypothetical protein
MESDGRYKIIGGYDRVESGIIDSGKVRIGEGKNRTSKERGFKTKSKRKEINSKMHTENKGGSTELCDIAEPIKTRIIIGWKGDLLINFKGFIYKDEKRKAKGGYEKEQCVLPCNHQEAGDGGEYR